MFNDALKILNIIHDNGFEAYIVGGYVRDKILNIDSKDIDITTNAKPDDLLNIFDNISILKYGVSKLLYNNHMYEITTYRKDYNYEDFRRPNKIEYVDTLYEDLLRRDFTINTLCIDKNGEILDLLGGMSDINNKVVKCILNPKIVLKEDPVRILRAIRFVSKLGFNMDESLLKEVKNNSNLLSHISYDRKKYELNKIFNSANLINGLEIIKGLDLYKSLEIEPKNTVIMTNNVLGVWAQLDYSSKYNFSNNEKNIIKQVRDIINKKEITVLEIYKYDKESIYIAAEILEIDYTLIDNMYNSMPILKRADINIKYDDIISVINVTNDEINDIYIDLEKEILYNNLNNKKESIISYIKDKYEKR